jgi:hypothetical protein
MGLHNRREIRFIDKKTESATADPPSVSITVRNHTTEKPLLALI